QSQKTNQQFLIDGIDIANTCDLKYKNSQNQRLLVELCLMQLASLTFQDEKKNSNSDHHFVIPPSYFKSEKNTSEKITSAGSIVPKPSEIKIEIETEIEVEVDKRNVAEPTEEISKGNNSSEIATKQDNNGGNLSENKAEKVIERPQILAERNA